MIINTMPIGPDGAQIGVAMLSDAPRVAFHLNAHATKESLTAALGVIRPRNVPTINTGAALDFVRTNMFQTQRGSRFEAGVPQFLVLVTSKKSSDSLAQPALELLRKGVLTIAIGPKSVGEEELRQIAFAESAVYVLKDIRVLSRPAAQQPKEILNVLTTMAGMIVTEVPTEGRFFSLMHFEYCEVFKVVNKITGCTNGCQTHSFNFLYFGNNLREIYQNH